MHMLGDDVICFRALLQGGQLGVPYPLVSRLSQKMSLQSALRLRLSFCLFVGCVYLSVTGGFYK